jgi:hypothetical protein
MPNQLFNPINVMPVTAVLPAKRNYLFTGVLGLIFLFALLQSAIAFLTYQQTLTFDESMWQYIGRNWFRHGLVPYTGGVDNKSPLIFSIFGLSDKLFGVNFWFPRLLGIVFQCSGIWFIYKIGKHLFGSRSGIYGMTIYGLSLLWQATGGKYVSYSESYEVAFTIIAFYLAIAAKNNSWFFSSGLLATIGFFFRVSGLFGMMAILISLLVVNRRKLPLFIAGVVAGFGLISLFLLLSGVRLHDFINYTFLDNFGAGSVTDHPVWWKMSNLFNHFILSWMFLFLPAVAGFFFIRERNPFIFSWLIGAFISISIIGSYSTQHFKELLPPLSLMSAGCLNYLLNNHYIGSGKLLWVLWIVFFPKQREPFVAARQISSARSNSGVNADTLDLRENDIDKKQLGYWIKANTAEDATVYIAGYGAIAQAYSERISPTRYFNVTQTRAAKESISQEMEVHKPNFLFIPAFGEYKTNVDADLRLFIDRLAGRYYIFDKTIYGYRMYRVNNGTAFYFQKNKTLGQRQESL